jgi:phosphoglucomutase
MDRYMGKDTHACRTGPATPEVLAANSVETIINATPASADRHYLDGILTHNRERSAPCGRDWHACTTRRRTGVSSPPPNGGPADIDVTSGFRIGRTSAGAGNAGVKRVPL